MYSTLVMVQLIEGTCVRLMGGTSSPVSYRVDVNHLAPNDDR